MPNIIRVPGGGQTKFPSDLSPLCPNFKVERNGGKVKITADKIQLNDYTNMVSGGVWAWGKNRPVKPTGTNLKQWTRAELITTPIRALPDGTYDLVPDDPALTQTVSTLADDEVPLEVEIDWPESDPLIARQWVYNEKGVYQTMLLGGVASTEDAPAFELPTFTGNHAIFGDEIAGRIELYESGDLTLYPGIYDFFLVGGGGNGASYPGFIPGGGGGGGGYTVTEKSVEVQDLTVLNAYVGAALTATSLNGSIFSENSLVAQPGNSGVSANGGAGGSGGGGGGRYQAGGSGGSDGTDGATVYSGNKGGAGQGTTTRLFGEAGAALYSGGGGGGSTSSYGAGAGGAGGGGMSGGPTTPPVAGTPNTGGGGGGAYATGTYEDQAAAGGSGVIVIRWNNT